MTSQAEYSLSGACQLEVIRWLPTVSLSPDDNPNITFRAPHRGESRVSNFGTSEPRERNTIKEEWHG
jgi:hypothetical protein